MTLKCITPLLLLPMQLHWQTDKNTSLYDHMNLLLSFTWDVSLPYPLCDLVPLSALGLLGLCLFTWWRILLPPLGRLVRECLLQTWVQSCWANHEFLLPGEQHFLLNSCSLEVLSLSSTTTAVTTPDLSVIWFSNPLQVSSDKRRTAQTHLFGFPGREMRREAPCICLELYTPVHVTCSDMHFSRASFQIGDQSQPIVKTSQTTEGKAMEIKI